MLNLLFLGFGKRDETSQIEIPGILETKINDEILKKVYNILMKTASRLQQLEDTLNMGGEKNMIEKFSKEIQQITSTINVLKNSIKSKNLELKAPLLVTSYNELDKISFVTFVNDPVAQNQIKTLASWRRSLNDVAINLTKL